MSDTAKKKKPHPAGKAPRKKAAPKSSVVAVSSFSTGDFGGRYQDKVGGWLLAHLLMNQPMPGVEAAVSSVAFQRSAQGALLDDVVVTFAEMAEVEFSIKSGLKITANDEEYRETLGLAWARTRRHPDAQAGLIVPVSLPGIKMLQRLAFIARHQPLVSDFMDAISKDKVVSSELRARFTAARTILDEAKGSPLTDAEYHDFWRRFIVLGIDLDLPPALDLGPLLMALQGIQGITADQAQALYSRLTELGEDAAIASGSWDRGSLIRRLTAEGLAIGLPSDLRPTIEALDAYTERIREVLRDDIGGVRLDRTSVIESAQRALAEGGTSLISGPSGVGKSVVIRELIDQLRQRGPVLFLSGRRLQAAGSWAALAADIGIPADRAALRRVLETHADGITVVLDAAEHVQSVGARAAVNDLFAALRGDGQTGVTLRVVIGTRDNTVRDVLGWLLLQNVPPLRHVKMDVLNKAERSRISEASPALAQLLARVGSNAVTGNLMILRMLSDERIPQSSLPSEDASEVDLLDVWWEHILVGSEPLQHARRAIAYDAAERAVQAPSGLFTLPSSLDAEALATLERDGILAVDKTSDRYRFGHDIIEDWAEMRWLNREPDQLIDRLGRLGESSGLYRPVSLLAQALLERDGARYDEVSRFLEETDATRWQQAFAAAPVVSSRARTLLAARTPYLLEDQAQRLARLLTLVKVEQIDVAVSEIDRMVRSGLDVPTATAVAAANARPRLVVWAPLVGLCLANLGSLNSAAAPFFGLVGWWQRVTPPGFSYRTEILDAAFWALGHLEGWRKAPAPAPEMAVPYDDEKTIEEMARSIVAHSTDIDAPRIAAYLSELIAKGWGNAQDDMLRHAAALARHLPSEAVDFAYAVLCERERRIPMELDMSELGLRREYFPPSDVQGPFLALLHTDEGAGLSLVRRLAARAQDIWQRRMAAEGLHHRPLRFRFRDRAVELYGDERSYGWFRPSAHDSSVLTSALMAVDTWAYNAVSNGRDVVDVVDLLLSDTTAVSFLGIAIGLGYDFPALVPAMLDAVASPWLWRLERAREQQDMFATQDAMKMLPAEFQIPDPQPHLTQRNKDRDAKRTSTRLLMSYAARLLFDDEGAHRERFVQTCASRAIVDATLFTEEADGADSLAAPRETEKEFLSKTNPKHFVVAGGHVQWRPGEGVLPSEAQMRRDAVRQAMLLAELVGAKALLEYQAPPEPAGFENIGRTVQAAVAAGELTGGDLECARDAIVRCAAVAVTFLPRSGGAPSPWATDVLREAAAAYDARQWDPEQDDRQTTDLRLSIGTAIGAALAANPDDPLLRRWVFRAVGSGLPGLATACLRGLIPAWITRPETPLNVLGVVVTLALRTERLKAALPDEVLEPFIAADTAKRVQRLPKITARTKIASWRLAAALGGTPGGYDSPDALALLRPFLDQLIVLARVPRDEHDTSNMRLIGAVGAVAANVLVALPESDTGPFTALVGDPSSLEFFDSVLGALIRGHLRFSVLSEAAFARFLDLAEHFFAYDHCQTLRKEWLPNPFRSASWHFVFCEEFTGIMVDGSWPNARRFEDHITRWVAAVGGHPTTANALVAFIDRFLSSFAPAAVVGWLNGCWSNTAAPLRGKFWERNGAAIAQLLLRMLIDSPTAFQDVALRGAAAKLVDELVGAGVPTAGELRNTLENAYQR